DTDRCVIEYAYSLGAVDFLVKPLMPVVLRSKVAGFVELFEKTRQIQWQSEQLRQIDRREFEQKLADENARLREQQRRLLESETRKAAIVNTALDAIITIDHSGQIIEFNPAAENMFGYQRDSVLGQQIAQLIVPLHLREAHERGFACC